MRSGQYLLFAMALLLLAGSVTFVFLMNSRSVMAADTAFSDIPIDHPAYQICRHVINIGALKTRTGNSLAPFEKIAAAEWNFALQRIGNHLGRVIPETALFASDDEITGRAMLLRLQSLVDDTCGFSAVNQVDHTRLSAYFMLEQCLLAYINE